MDGSAAHVRLILLVCGGILAGVGEFNFVVDPAHLFRDSRFEHRVAAVLLSGQPVGNLGDHDERLVQKYLIRMDPAPRDVIVLGSSRVIHIGQDMVPGRRFFNHFISGASLEDDLAVIEMYRSRGALPRTIIVGLDPWLLNHESGQTRWQSLGDEYEEGVEWVTGEGRSDQGIVKGIRLSLKKVRELFSWLYLQAALRVWREGKSGPDSIDQVPAAEITPQIAVKRPDGVLVYPPSVRDRTPDEVRVAAIEYASMLPIYSLGGFRELDPKARRIFEALVDRLLRERVTLVFFLPPYHPLVYRTLMHDPSYRQVGEAQRYFEGLASRHGIPLVGSYNPGDCGLGEHDFTDGMHINENATRTVLFGCVRPVRGTGAGS
jgi:hypothetical protein